MSARSDRSAGGVAGASGDGAEWGTSGRFIATSNDELERRAVAKRLPSIEPLSLSGLASQPVPLARSKRLLEVTHRLALCACGPTAASERDIVCRLSAPLRPQPKWVRALRAADKARLRQTKMRLWARAPTSIEVVLTRTRTSEALNEDARRTIESARVHTATSSIEGAPCSSRRLIALSDL
jgi:hypothetical protein